VQLHSRYLHRIIAHTPDTDKHPVCTALAATRLSNSLPAHLRQTDINTEQFKRQLKTFCSGVKSAAHCGYY